jgi:hypothetical protein
MATHPGRQDGMRDLWMDREAAEMDSLQYFEEMALDDELIRLWELRQEQEREADYFQQAFKDLWEAVRVA